MTLVAITVLGALGTAALALWRQPAVPRGWPLLGLALAPQLLARLGGPMPGMFFLSMMIVFGWCVYNRAVCGATLAAAGVGANLLVMAWHGGAMPIRTDVLAAIGVAAEPGTLLPGSKDVAVLTSRLWLLSDWVIIPLPAGPIVASPGDLLVLAGIIWWLLFSRPLRKEHADDDAGRKADVARAPHTPAARAK